MKLLVIAERPSVTRNIARVLKCGKNQNGAIEGDHYIVTWRLDHLVTLTDPEDCGKKYREWKMEDLPILPDVFKLEVIGQTAKQYHTVRTQIHRKNVGLVITTTDTGREGELVARLILREVGSNKPIKQLWVSSVAGKAIREGFANLKDGKEYDGLYDATMCRAEADRMVGISATRALTCKYNAWLSCGRVQTPTLAMIAKREADVRSFVPKSFYSLQARGGGLTLTWQNQTLRSFCTFDRDPAQNILKNLKEETGVVSQVKRTPKKTFTPLLYDLAELQQDINGRFDYSAKEILNTMQRLYENRKVLTYPRMDSRYLNSDIIPALRERLKACAVGPYHALAGRLAMQASPVKPFFVDNSEVSNHHAIIPAEQFVQLDHMTVGERRIYDLVMRRFLAVVYPSFGYEQTGVSVQIDGESFIARGRIAKGRGWKAAYNNGAEEESQDDEGTAEGVPVKKQQLPDLKKGDRVVILSLSMTEGETKPPAPFNEATLLSAMENPVTYMESRDRAMAKTLGETGGLGTVATRADITEKLSSSFLFEKRGKDIYLTSKAKQLPELIPKDLKKPELTADWEMELSRTAKGNLRRGTFMSDVRIYSRALIGRIRAEGGNFRHDNLTNTKCPMYGKRMLAVKGKSNEMLVCQDRECGHRETISRASNARCPVCHEKMELKGKGEGQIFVCRCERKEKLSAFRDRRKRKGTGVSKRDVANYLNQQNKEAKEPISDAFAQALSGIKLDQKLEKFLNNSVSRYQFIYAVRRT